MQTLVIHTETGVRVGSFTDQNSAQEWLDQLAVSAAYKDRCYKLVPAADYWKRFYQSR